MNIGERLGTLRIRRDRLVRPLAIATALLLVSAVSSLGQVDYDRQQALTSHSKGASGGTGGEQATPSRLSGGGVGGIGDPPPSGPTDALITTDPLTGAPVVTGPRSGQSGGGGTTGVTGTTAPRTSATTPAAKVGVPDFGLKTQGVTDKQVKIGFTYNVQGCGDSGALSASFGAAVAGDSGKSIDAFTRYINDTGGIAGRNLVSVVADDGSGGCPEKAGAAAVKLVDEEKVFTVVPGFNPVADYAVSKKIPVYGGRDDNASTAKAGAGTFEPLESLDDSIEAWAAFGKNYLDTEHHVACLIHPDTSEWNDYEKLAVASMARQGLKFKSFIRYAEDVSSAATQSNAAAVKAKGDGCDQAYFMAYNPIALVFLTSAAQQNNWNPTWTWTSFTALVDSELIGRLMNQNQWAHAISLSARVPPGQHPKEGNCKKIYESYYPNDGESDSAAVYLACYAILPLAESMRRAVTKTGVLTANSLMVGADSITNDYSYDSHVPIDWQFPGPNGPFKQKGFSHFTVAKWNTTGSKYDFPEYPKYWKTMGPGRSGAEDLRPFFK